MDYHVFIVGSDNIILSGMQSFTKEFYTVKNFTITVKHVSFMELMQLDASYKFKNKYSIAIVPTHLYEVLNVFADMQNIKMLPGNVSITMLKDYLDKIVVNDNEAYRKKKGEGVFLTSKERKYCFMVYNGISNKTIARHFQCTEKNLSYLKRKIMAKWHCKNSLEFFRFINYFYCDKEKGLNQ